LQLFAWYFPAQSGRAVILVHGKDACRGQEFKSSSFVLTAKLIEEGFSVFMIDMRGHGSSDSALMTYGKRERQDVLGALDWLMAQGYAAGSIGVLGASMGAVSAIGAAAEDTAIGAVVADSGFADFSQVMAAQFTKQSKLPGFMLPGALAIAHWQTGVNLARFRPVDDMAWLLHRPVLIIHAEDDPFIPLHHAYTLAKAGMGRTDLWVTSGNSHLASFREQPNLYSERVAAFFNQHLTQPVDVFLQMEPYRVTISPDSTYGKQPQWLTSQSEVGLFQRTALSN
jgi:pimeloyl-ACP methyl ester carboxylesterase